MTKILVTDGRLLSALAIVRSLGEKGFEIHCGDDFRYNLSSFSKYVDKRILYPSTEHHPSDFIKYIINIIKSERYDMVIPVGDETTSIFSKYKDQISRLTNIYVADPDIIKKFRDKGETIKLAIKEGVPIPNTYYPEEMDVQNIKKIAQFPILIRPRVSSGSRGIAYVESPDEFDDIYNNIKREYGEPLIQEYVQKTGYVTSCILMDENQEIVASFAYRRIKEYPLSGGPTVVGVSCEDPEAAYISAKLLRSAKWRGVAEIEFVLDSEGKPLLLEVNPRFWMPLNLAIKAGVDFPFLLYRLAHGEIIIPINSYEIGLKYRWILPNEILWLIQTPDKVKGIKEFINFWEGNTCYGVLSIYDPMPAVGTIIQSLIYISNSQRRNSIFKRGW